MCDQCVEHAGKMWHLAPSGYYEATFRLHRFVWEQANGPIPKDHHVHHRNGNKTDNRLENLELLSHGEHSARHYAEKLLPHRERALASSRATRERLANERAQRVLVCQHCGGEYSSRAVHPRRFCSSACTDAARAILFDPEQRQCSYCGESYVATRSAQHYCSKRCNNRAASDRLGTIELRPVRCASCGGEFQSKRSNARFCRRECALRYHADHRVRGKVSEAV